SQSFGNRLLIRRDFPRLLHRLSAAETSGRDVITVGKLVRQQQQVVEGRPYPQSIRLLNGPPARVERAPLPIVARAVALRLQADVRDQLFQSGAADAGCVTGFGAMILLVRDMRIYPRLHD